VDLAVVRREIAEAAAAVVLPGTALTCTGYVPDSVVPPCGFCAETDIEFDKAMRRGLDEFTVTFRLLAGRADDRAGQALLDSLLAGSGATSVKAAIEAVRGAPGQPALGGAASDLHVTRMQGYRYYEHQGVPYVGAELVIRVIGPGS
jgi:hypothetical protein